MRARSLPLSLTIALGTTFMAQSAMAGRWVPDGNETQSTVVSNPEAPSDPTPDDPPAPSAPDSGATVGPAGDDCDPDQTLPNITKKSLVQETVLSETTESLSPATHLERRDKAQVTTTTSLPDQLLSFSYVKRVEGRFRNQYALQTWGQFKRTTTVQPYAMWEVSNWKERKNSIVERTYQTTEWDQMVTCPSGQIDSELVDISLSTEEVTVTSPWQASSSAFIVSEDEDPPVVVDTMVATYSKEVLVHKQTLAGIAAARAGAAAPRSQVLSGDLTTRAQQALSASSGQVRNQMGAARVQASAATSGVTTYSGTQAAKLLAGIVKAVNLNASGFGGSLQLVGGKVVHEGTTYAVKEIRVSGTTLQSVTFYGPGDKAVTATVAP
ncbi:MAG: hypothetical protein VKO64_02440 [Candidatus Sericytochromatia bacterium]|nr:hypothetical protein [Candidatus Sericytochromatia bacterium]